MNKDINTDNNIRSKSNSSDYTTEINDNNFFKNVFNSIKKKLTQKALPFGNEKHVTNTSISSMWRLAQIRSSITESISRSVTSIINRFSKQNPSQNKLETEIIGNDEQTKESDNRAIDDTKHYTHSTITNSKTIIMPPVSKSIINNSQKENNIKDNSTKDDSLHPNKTEDNEIENSIDESIPKIKVETIHVENNLIQKGNDKKISTPNTSIPNNIDSEKDLEKDSERDL